MPTSVTAPAPIASFVFPADVAAPLATLICFAAGAYAFRLPRDLGTFDSSFEKTIFAQIYGNP